MISLESAPHPRNVECIDATRVSQRTDTTHAVTYYYQQDHEGSVTHLTNGSGAVVETYQYDAFGAPSTVSAWGNPFMFTGRRYQPALGVYEYRARAYQPRLGRFTSEDPSLFDAGDYNLFRYCHNDPLDLTDPMGLETPWSGAGPQNPDNHASVEKYAEIMGKVQWAMRWSTQGAVGMGTAGYQAWSALRLATTIHDPVKEGKHYLQSSNYYQLGDKVARMAEEKLQANPSEHEELSIVSQNNSNSRDFLASLPTAQHYNGKTQDNYSNVYDRNDPRQVDPSARGYHAVANVVAQKLWVPHIRPSDRANIHKTGLDAFISMPGQPGTNRPIEVRFYDEHNVYP